MAKSKKSYLNNPALSFISSAIISDSEEDRREETPAPAEAKEETTAEAKEAPVAAPAPERPAEVTPAPAPVPAPVPAPKRKQPAAREEKKGEAVREEKKSDADRALDMGSAAPALTELEAPLASSSTKPMKLFYVEVRSKRVNVLMQPTLYESLSEIAKYNGVSVNEVIHRACEEFVKR